MVLGVKNKAALLLIVNKLINIVKVLAIISLAILPALIVFVSLEVKKENQKAFLLGEITKLQEEITELREATKSSQFEQSIKLEQTIKSSSMNFSSLITNLKSELECWNKEFNMDLCNKNFPLPQQQEECSDDLSLEEKLECAKRTVRLNYTTNNCEAQKNSFNTSKEKAIPLLGNAIAKLSQGIFVETTFISRCSDLEKVYTLK